MFKKYLQLICLMISGLKLERNDNYFSDGNEKECPPNKLVHCYEGGYLPCSRPHAGALHCYSPVCSWPFIALPFVPDAQPLSKILLRTSSVGSQNQPLGFKANI